MTRIRIAAIQMTLREGETAENSSRAEGLLHRAGEDGAALAVLPEMWWAGFAYRSLPSLSGEVEASLEAAGKIARRYGMTIVGGWPEWEGERVFNAACVIGPDGLLRKSYRKVHLFRPMKEDRFLDAGGETVTVELEFGRLGLALCYDLRFPEFVRKLALEGAALIAAPAQWPHARVKHFETLLRARSIENQLFMVGANRCGKGGAVSFGGRSAVIGPRGETLAELGDEEGIALADVDLDEVAAAREEISYLDDRVQGVDY